VNELASLGLQPDVLHELIEASEDTSPPASPPELEQDQVDPDAASTHSHHHLAGPKVVYELNNISGRIEPRLRIWTRVATPPLLSQEIDNSVQTGNDDHEEGESEEGGEREGEGVEQVVSPAVSGHTSLLWDFQRLYFGGHAAGGREDIRGELNAKGPKDSE
jgi:hypothetical protein